MLKDTKLFIFDWDGTLSTSTSLVKFSSLFKRRYTFQDIKEHENEYKHTSLLGLKAEEEEHKIGSYLYGLYSIFTKPKLREDAIPLLKYLHSKKKKIAIFSDGVFFRLLAEARMFDIPEHVDFMLSASTIKRYKPNPAGLLLISKEMKIKPKDALYIGDMASDVMTAKFAKMPSAALCGGLNDYETLKIAKPDYIFRSLREMLQELKK